MVYGLGKPRSKFGRFMDAHGISQEDVRRISKVSRNTVSKAFNEDAAGMRYISKQALARAAAKLTGKDVDIADFW